MTTLRKLVVKNFQSHELSEIELCSGINIFLGDNLAGKTALLRAIKLLTTNRPLGFRYHSNFAKDSDTTEVGIELSDGTTIRTIKGSSDPKYVVNSPGSKPIEFRAVRSDVPDLVNELLNITEVNTQSQLDSPFLVSGSQFAKILNRTTNIEKVEEWRTILTIEINSSKARAEVLEKDAKKCKSYLMTLALIDEEELLTAVNASESIGAKLEGLRGELIDLYTTLTKLVRVKKKTELLTTIKDCLETVVKNSEGLAALQAERDDIVKYLKLVTTVNDTRALHNKLTNALTKWGEAQQDMKHLLSELDEKKSGHYLIKNYLGQTVVVEECEKAYKKARQAYTTLLKKEKTCPTCYSKIDDSTIKRILEEI